MLKSHEKFHSANGRRLILVADDEQINRELLGHILESEYEVVYAADGQETLDQVKKYMDELSLVLLDLMMPIKPGLEVLRELKADPELRHIPVIVLTADQNAEVESLTVGAIDYIPKPYPHAGIIHARIVRAIELTEDREIIRSTERDPLTGLYNREYFYSYAEQYDQHHKDTEMDAIVVDVNHFHMINERFGNPYGDEVLRRIGEKIRETVADTGGIVCRREADTFMVYCPHGVDYREIIDNAAIGLEEDESVNSRVRLRLGVYAGVDKSLDVERRFDRAKMAADTVRNSFTKTIGVYDRTMHERELYAEQLIDDFQRAIEEKQFQVYYQPKFDIRPKAPALTSAEALVRWQHPTLGMISPGVFIPLFEDNGLIQELDNYVWRQTAAQIRDWKDRIGFSVPVSVNVSRIDMYDPELLEKFQAILAENRLETGDLMLEITESAYTQDSAQIIDTVNRLRDMGFRIEMDDFGTGYSSLNMISALPIDALKLDMLFIRSAFQDQQDTRMLEVIIDIADHLAVPVIAEGVETEEQVAALKALGCDIVQGYYFSRPVPAEAFEPFLEVRSSLTREELLPEIRENPAEETPEETEEIPQEAPPKKSVRLRAISYVFVITAIILAVALVISDAFINRSHRQMDEANERHALSVQAASDLGAGSDYLTVSVRSFVVLSDLKYMNDYFEEVNVTRRRDRAVEKLEELLPSGDRSARDFLAMALDTSNELLLREYHAMHLTQLAEGYDDSVMPDEVTAFELSPEELAMSPEEMRAVAEALVFDEGYMEYKDQIRSYIAMCTDQLIAETDREMTQTRTDMDRMMAIQIVLLVLLLLAVLGEVVFITTQLRVPLALLVEHMRTQEPAPQTGAEELRFVTQTYNEILEENRSAQKQLTYEALHDPLTGLMNRSAYDAFMADADQEHLALLILDVDRFRSINATYGHDVGDRILKRVAEVLKGSFRSVDAVCRIGGDEFVVVMTRVTSAMRPLIADKIARANAMLQNPKDGLPKTSLSVGIAFSDRENPADDIFRDADTALYQMKQSGSSGYVFYGEETRRSES